jgi:GT2 family glycosyltransferase
MDQKLPMARPALTSVIVLAYGPEAHLEHCVAAVLDSADDSGQPVDLELLIVDNGALDAVSRLPRDDRVTIVRPERNLGFAGGCNAGAEIANGDVLVFVNSDAIVDSAAVDSLGRALTDREVGIVSGSVRLADRSDLMNTAGNPVHFLGLSWAGGFGEPFQRHKTPVDIASASGALFALRTDTWHDLGGFDEHYFAYHEDVDLSLRTWQRGLRVQFEPSAVAIHHYAFSRNPNKQYLLERNRWITLLTVFPRTALLAGLPAAPLLELLMCAAAARQGWLPDKLRSYRWIIKNRHYLRERRRVVQGASKMPPAEFLRLLSSRIEPAGVARPPGLGAVNVVLASYWRLALHLCKG